MKTNQLSDSSNLVTLENIQNCYEQWYQQYIPEYNYRFISCTYEDKGLKALRLIKFLMDRKLVKIDTVEKFISLMDEMVKIL